ncbi:TIGR04282 family arsenosugar biosynthesis glycosyltransferase [Saccharopolyspora cebuensis]|uniref:DUF2064 domain-containing protein n=1 Tax=Saccharopolyspora cebuensis TaxID=418759 RepID=A0ABV4CGJ8_9PSEU
MSRAVILVVAKAPRPGEAKTRLAASIGPVAAAEIAAASLLDTLEAVCAVPDAAVRVAWTGELAGARRDAEVGDALARTSVFPQCGGGLAERLAAAHRQVAEELPTTPVLQIGMDTPQITGPLLAESIEPLRTAGGPGAVLGPADDGGWWALGLRDPRQARLLRGVAMSAEDTGRRTEEALRAVLPAVGPLPGLADVDTIADARQVAALIPDSRFSDAVRHHVGVGR